MTSVAFIMGVWPLVASKGDGAEMRHAMGIAVFSGMIGVTCFGLLLTPVVFVLIRRAAGRRRRAAQPEPCPSSLLPARTTDAPPRRDHRLRVSSRTCESLRGTSLAGLRG
jgi:hypothetical protein